MKHIADLLFEARFLKRVPRSGFQFLGNGTESVAEHAYVTTFIAFTLSKMVPSADPLKLVTMCLVHDLPEARIGDLNYVQKQYVDADEAAAVHQMCDPVPFGGDILGLIEEFNAAESEEARLARDADQLSLVLDLKSLIDRGYRPAEKWLPHVAGRLRTEAGKALFESILDTERDAWWLKNYIDNSGPQE